MSRAQLELPSVLGRIGIPRQHWRCFGCLFVGCFGFELFLLFWDALGFRRYTEYVGSPSLSFSCCKCRSTESHCPSEYFWTKVNKNTFVPVNTFGGSTALENFLINNLVLLVFWQQQREISLLELPAGVWILQKWSGPFINIEIQISSNGRLLVWILQNWSWPLIEKEIISIAEL